MSLWVTWFSAVCPSHTPTAPVKSRPPWRMRLLSQTMRLVRLVSSGSMKVCPIYTPSAPTASQPSSSAFFSR